MNKLDVQKRILQYGKPIDLNKFNWDENTKTLSTNENYLIIDFGNVNNCTFNTGHNCTFNTGNNCTFDTGSNCTFNTGYNCTFKTGYNCTFNTGSSCTFKTGSNCTFNTGYNCTFNTDHNCTFKTGSYCIFKTGSYCIFKTSSYCTFDTGHNCTFKTGYNCTFNTGYNCTFNTGYDCTFDTGDNCVIIRRDIFEVIKIKPNIKYRLRTKNKGYLTKKENEDEFHLKVKGKRIPWIIADGIESEIIHKKENNYIVRNEDSDKLLYLVKHEENDKIIYSHGETLKQAKEDLVYKITNRNKSDYEHLTIDSKLTHDESIICYRTITGACSIGVKEFITNTLNGNKKEEYTIREIIDLTKNQYGNESFKQFFIN